MSDIEVVEKPGTSLATEVEKARAVQQVQTALVIAKKFPRDEVASEKRIMVNCQRLGLAEKATYLYPRGGQSVTGPSIRLAETLAQAWGNIEYGFTVLEELPDSSVVECFCHDLETNTKVRRTVTIVHAVRLKNGTDKKLSDPRDRYENTANNAQRRVRATILEVIPGDVVERAVNACKKTLAAGGGEPLIDRIKKMVVSFGSLGVSQEMLEKRLGHPVAVTTGDECVELLSIFNSLRDGESKRQQWFEFDVPNEDKAAEVAAAIASPKVASQAPRDPASCQEGEGCLARGRETPV